MSKTFIIFLLFLCFFKVKVYDYETLEELMPKTIFLNKSDSYVIMKYKALCAKDHSTNINFQTTGNFYSLFGYVYLYDDLSKATRNKNGYFVDFNEQNRLYNNIIFNNITCQKDYYFIILYFETYPHLYNNYYQVTIINEETNIFNLSPISSQYYTFFQRQQKLSENFIYEFNETRYAFIQIEEGNLKIKDNDAIIFDNNGGKFDKIFEFQKNKKYYLYFSASSTDFPIHFQFYNESKFFKYNKNNNLIMLYGSYKTYYLEIDISDYHIGEYIYFSKFMIVQFVILNINIK